MEDREMHKAVCADCGKECEVPFKPTEGRPVKCKDCFSKSRPQRDNSRGRGNFGGNRGNFSRERRDFDVTCSECGKKTTVPFKPTQGKPVLCRECYKNSKN